MIARRLRIRGLVQGVFYREAMRQRAQELGVTGWVRNRSDGSVEAVVQGAAMDVERLTDWARRGPPAARVEAVETEAADDEPGFSTFDKKPTI
jgi:acylphosphatase